MTPILNRIAQTAALVAFSALAAQAQTAETPEKPDMMSIADGMSLYYSDKDVDGVSTCYGDCADKWMPFLGKADDKQEEGWTQVARNDGMMQWAYEGKPVYLYEGDKAKGDITGLSLDGTWHTLTLTP